MTEVINVAKEFREENMKEQHKFSFGDQVVINFEETEDIYWLEDRPELYLAALKSQPFFIVECDRDCDGTPLYSLSLIPLTEEVKDVQKHFIFKMGFPMEDISDARKAYDAIKQFYVSGINGDGLVSYSQYLEGEE